MKDEAKDEAVIVFLGPGVAAFPRKHAGSRDMHRQTPSKKPGAMSARAFAQFYRILFSMRVALRSQEKFRKISERLLLREVFILAGLSALQTTDDT